MLSSIFRHSKGAAMAMAGALALSLCSCDSSFVYEDLRECVPDYRVRLSYDYNMSGAQKVQDVEAAEIYAFTMEGDLAAVVKADKQTLIDNDWSLPVPLKRNWEYDLVVWAGLVENSPFSLDGTRTVTSKEDLTCRLATETDEQGRIISQKEFPHLFHSATKVAYQVEDGLQERVVSLVKNTNVIDIVIRSERDEDAVSDDYDVEITGNNNDVMAHDNTVLGTNFTYLPAGWTSGEYPFSDGEGGYTQEGSHAVVAEMHYGRLIAGSDAELVVKRSKTGDVYFKHRLLDLFSKLKNRVAPNMPIQEYLDRQDYYRVDIVLTTQVAVYINGWRIILNNMEWN